MREEIDGLYAGDGVFLGEPLQVASLGSRIATDIYNQGRFHVEDLLNQFIVHAGPGRIGDDHIGSSVLFEKRVVADVDHIAGKEGSVRESISFGVDAGIVDGGFDQLYTDDFFCVLTAKDSDAAGTAIQVVHDLIAAEFREIARDAIEFFGLFGIGLEKRSGTDLEGEFFQGFNYIAGAFVYYGSLIE